MLSKFFSKTLQCTIHCNFSMSCREKDSSHVIRVPDVEVSKVFYSFHMQLVLTVRKLIFVFWGHFFFLQATPLCLEFSFNSEIGPSNLGKSDLQANTTSVSLGNKFYENKPEVKTHEIIEIASNFRVWMKKGSRWYSFL